MNNPGMFLEIYQANFSSKHECPNLSFKIHPNEYYQEKVNEGRKGPSANLLNEGYPPCLCCGIRFNTNMSKPWRCTFQEVLRCRESNGYGHYGVFMPNIPQEQMICFYCHFYIFCKKNNKLQSKIEFYLIGCTEFKIDSQSDEINKLQNKILELKQKDIDSQKTILDLRQYVQHLQSVIAEPKRYHHYYNHCI